MYIINIPCYHTVCVLGVVLIVASLFGLSYGICSTSVLHPSEGIANGVGINERVEITCQCGLQLQPGTWYFNGSEISSSTDFVPHVSFNLRSLGFTTLVIPNFLPQYAGNYTCASTSDRRDLTVIELSVSQQCE